MQKRQRSLGLLLDRPLLVSVALTAAFFAFSVWFFPSAFETNDDAFMSLIAAGRLFTDSPDEHLLFTHVFVGLGLAALYGFGPDFPWYGCYLFAVMGASVLALVYALLRANPTVKQCVLVAALLIAFVLPGLVHPQFTRVAFLAVLTGLTLMSAAPGRLPSKMVWVGAGLVLLGGLVRFQAVLLAYVIFVPVMGAVALRA
jgi:hypothetical protein